MWSDRGLFFPSRKGLGNQGMPPKKIGRGIEQSV
jgi:hypothetical protein